MALIVIGKSEKPVYINIKGEQITLMGWEKDGAVSKEKLKELGLDEVLNIKNNVL